MIQSSHSLEEEDVMTRWTVLEGKQKPGLWLRLWLFCMSYALLALVVGAPAAYAYHGQYDKDWGQVSCGAGKKEAFQIRARGNPVTVRAHSGNGAILVSDKFNTYSGATTRYYHPSTAMVPNPEFVEWLVFTDPDEAHAYVSREDSFGYCY
jgi:hypothetical protein